MSNLYLIDNRFVLRDVDGLALGTDLIVREPVNMADTMITIKRSQFHGMDYEYSDIEVPFTFDNVAELNEPLSGKQLLEQLYEIAGVDSKCKLLIQEKAVDSLTWITSYEGDLDFETYEEDEISVKISSRRVNFDDKLRTREEVPISLDSTTSLDGSVITPPSGESMFLHPKVLRSSQKSSTASTTSQALPTLGEGYLLLFDFKSNVIPQSFTEITGYTNEIQSKFGNSSFTSGFVNLDPKIIEPAYTFPNSGRLTIDITVDFLLNLSSFSGSGSYNWAFNVYVNGEVNQTVSSGSASGDPDLAFTDSIIIEITAGDTIFFGMTWNYPSVTGNYALLFDTDHLIEMSFDEVAQPSSATVYKPFDIINHLVNSMTEQTSGVVSDFLETTLADIRLTNGYSIRGFSRPPKTSFKDFFEMYLYPVFGLGKAYVTTGGAQKILIDRFDRFYRNKKIILIDNLEKETYTVEIDEDVHFNEIETGYKELPKSTDKTTTNNIDEFNSKHWMITPLQRVKNKLTAISDYITSGFLIENQRREQFKDEPSETSDEDENMFAVNGLESDTYSLSGNAIIGNPDIELLTDGTLILEGNFFDIEAGDEITIDTSSPDSVEQTYTISDVQVRGGKTDLVTDITGIDATYTGAWTLTRNTSRLRAQRNDEFDSVTNVISPETSYNIGLNPKYILLNHSKIINSGLIKKDETTEEIKTQKALLNEEMTCQFKTGEGAYTLAQPDQTVGMSSSILLENMDRFRKIFTGLKYRFTAYLSYETIKTIRESYTDIDGEINYGYIDFIDPFGNLKTGYLEELSYNPLNQKTNFILKGRNPVNVLDEYEIDLLIGYASSALACAGTGTPTTYYMNTPVLEIGTIIYSTSQDQGTTLADQWVLNGTTSIEIVSGVVATITECVIPDPDVLADYNFLNAISGGTVNTTTVTIEGLNYGETNNNDINIGTDGTSVAVSLVVVQADLDAVFGDDIAIRVEAWNGTNDLGTQIGTTQTTQTSTPKTILASLLIPDTEITGTDIFIRVTKLNLTPE